MAGVTAKDIDDYGQYLLKQGAKPEDVKAYTDYLGGHHGADQAPKMSGGQAALVKGAEGITAGLSPAIQGVGGAIGNLYGQYESGRRPINLDQAKQAFVDTRTDAINEQNQAQKEHPYISTAANVAGSIPTLAVAPVGRGLSGALKLGAGLGVAQAAGSAQSLPEAAMDIGGATVLGGAGYGAGKVLSKGVQALSDSKLGQKMASGLSKTASALTGVPDKEIETYATQYDKVSKLLEESGGQIPVAAEIQKENIQNAVKTTKNNLNSQISEALASAPQDKNIDINPVIQKIKDYQSRLNPHLNPEGRDQIGQLIQRIQGASEGGKVNVQDLQQIKQFLGDQATSAFNGSALGFQIGPEASNAAKNGYLEAKNLMDNFGPHEIKNANRQLFQLHKIEERINKNLILPGKSDAALMAVGSGAQNRDTLALQRLGQLSGQDIVGNANVLSAANRFNNPSWSPAYGTGKSLLPVAMGGAAGGALTHTATGAAIGAGIGGAVASPAALKLAIDTGRISVGALKSVASAFGVPNDLNSMARVLQMPQAQEVLIRAMAQENQAAAGSKGPVMSTNIRARSKLSK